MRHLSFDLARDLQAASEPLRNLDEERFRFTIVMTALEEIRRQPVRSEAFGRRAAIDSTVH